MSLPVPEALAAVDLPAPWVPEEWRAQVRAVNPHTFSTRADLEGMHNPFPLAEEAAAGHTADYVLYGTAGRGMQSNTVTYALVYGPLALFLEQALGNVYGDEQADAESVRLQWALADDLRTEIARHHWAPGARLLVIASDLTGTMWARLPGPLGEEGLRGVAHWHQAEGALASLRPVIDWLAAQEE